jgi:hypothetical protein
LHERSALHNLTPVTRRQEPLLSGTPTPRDLSSPLSKGREDNKKRSGNLWLPDPESIQFVARSFALRKYCFYTFQKITCFYAILLHFCCNFGETLTSDATYCYLPLAASQVSSVTQKSYSTRKPLPPFRSFVRWFYSLSETPRPALTRRRGTNPKTTLLGRAKLLLRSIGDFGTKYNVIERS